jgi:hypothetical protein
MPLDAEFYKKVDEQVQADKVKLRRICQKHGIKVEPGADLYTQAWAWIYRARAGKGIPVLPAELVDWLIDDAVWYGKGMYDRKELESEETTGLDLLYAYTDALASYAQSQV